MSVHSETVKQLDFLRMKGCLTEENAALAAICENLARSLDNGAGLAAAAVANQLRSTLKEIRSAKGDEDDDFDNWVSGLSAAGITNLGDPKDT